MANEVKNDMAVIQIIDHLGGASHLLKYVKNADDIQQICETVSHFLGKLANKHGLPPARKPDASKRIAKA